MASEVVRGGREDRRSYWVVGLVQAAVLVGVALAVAAEDQSSGERWLVPGLLGAAVLVLCMWGWAMPRLLSSWVAQISPDEIRWHGGWRRRDHVIRRQQVTATKPSRNPRVRRLELYDEQGDRVAILPLHVLPVGHVIAAMRRQQWPLPPEEDVLDKVARWHGPRFD